MSRRGVTLPRTCANCAHYEQRVVGRKEARQLKRKQRGKNGGHTFEFAAQPFQHSAAVVADVPRVSESVPSLETPGATQYRAETLDDVLAHLARGMVIGGAGACLGGVLVLFFPGLPIGRSVGGALLGFTAGGILVSVFQPQDIIVAKVEQWLQRDINGDGQVGTVRYVVEGTLRDERGNESYLKFELESDHANVKWHNFCRAVLYDKPRRNFSENEAKRHGLSSGDWKIILRTFAAQQWVVLAKRRGTPKLRGLGWQWVKHYADNPPTPVGESLVFGPAA